MKTFKEIIAEVQEPKAGIEKKFKEVNTKDGEKLNNPIATEPQFKGSTSKKKRIADKETGDGKVLPEETFNRLKSFHDVMESRAVSIEETFKAGSMKLKDGSTTKITNEEAESLNSLFAGLNSTNKKKMQERLSASKNSFSEIVKFAKEV